MIVSRSLFLESTQPFCWMIDKDTVLLVEGTDSKVMTTWTQAMVSANTTL